MTLETQILADIAVSQSTASALADRIGKSPNAIDIVLRRMADDGRVVSFGICDDRLTVWKLKTHTLTPCSTH